MDVDLVILQFSTVVLYWGSRFLILSQRKQNPMKDKLQCPGGKILNEDETPLECAKREMFEETGYRNVDDNRYNYVKTVQYGPSAYGQHPNCLRIVHLFWFVINEKFWEKQIRNIETEKMTPWQALDIDNINPEECIDILKDFLNDGNGIWRITQDHLHNFQLTHSPTMAYQIYTGSDYLASNEEVIWSKDTEIGKIVRPLVSYEIIKYLRSLAKDKWIQHISRKDLEEIMLIITNGNLNDFIQHVTWIHERFRQKIKGIKLPGNTLYNEIEKIVDERDNQLSKLKFIRPKKGSRRETLVKTLVDRARNIDENDE